MRALRPATAEDLPAVTAFLRRHEQTSMFPLANLAGSGLGGTSPYGMRVWLAGTGGGMVGLTNGGMLQPQWPDAPDWGAAAIALGGASVIGAIGPADQIGPLIRALGLDDAPRQHDAVEPGFALDLNELVVPEGPGRLAALDAAPRDLLVAFRTAYEVEVMGAAPDQAAARASDTIDRWRAEGSHRALIEGGRPVAVCGVNARLPDVVQAGAVYVPPDLRGQGRARRAVALMLERERAQGVARAVLFAASPAAVAAYRAIGFRAAAPMHLVLFSGPQQVGKPWP